MAFLIPLIEGVELLEGLFVASEAVGVAEAAGAGAVAAETVALADAGAMETAAIAADAGEATMYDVAGEGVAYENPYELGVNEEGYARVPLEEPDIGPNVEVGYDMQNVRPYDPSYWGPAGEAGYTLLPTSEEVVPAESSIFSTLRDDALFRNVVTIGAGKAVFVAGLWYILDPITGAPIYAIAGDDPRVDQVMQALGYTQSAREAGLVLREWFAHLFGYNMSSSPAGPSTTRVSDNAPRRPPRPIDQSISQSRPLGTNFEQMAYASSSRRRKRPRTSYDVANVAVPSSSIPVAPSMKAMLIRRQRAPGRRRITTSTRTLCRFVQLAYRKNANVMEFLSNLDANWTSVKSNSAVAGDGFVYSNNCVGMVFKLVDFPQYTDLTNAFDQYRMKYVSITFMPARYTGEPSDANPPADFSVIPTWLFAEDRDDVNFGPNYENVLASKQGMKFTRMSEPFTIRVRPQAWTNTSNVSKTKVLGGWIPTTVADAIHFGLKAMPLPSGIANSETYGYNLCMCIKASFECKHAD